MNFKEWLILTEKIMIKDQEFRNIFPALQHIQKTHPNSENLVVTFTEINKVGINPQSKYDTPIGIYLYPLDYVIEKKMNVPFAANQPHINVCEFTRPEKILHMTSDTSNQKGMELLNVFPKERLDKADEYINEYKIRSNYSKLWLLTRMLANNKPIQWNSNLRKCGIDGFLDHGTGTICPEEPTQCVVFTASALKLLYSIDSPMYYKKTDKFGVDTYYEKKYKYDSSKMSDEQIIRMLQSRRDLDIGSLIDSATDKDKMTKLIIKHKPELSYNDASNLMKSSIEKDEIAELIMQSDPELSNNDVITLMQYVTNKDKMAEAIIKYKPELSDNNVHNLIRYADKIDKIAELIIEKKPELSDGSVANLMKSSIDKDGIAEIIINKKTELTSGNVYNFLSYATKKDKRAALLGTYNISKLSNILVLGLIKYAPDKKQMAKIINKYHTKKTPEIQEILDKYLTQTIAAK